MLCMTSNHCSAKMDGRLAFQPKTLQDSPLAALLILAFCGCTDAASLTNDASDAVYSTGLSDVTISILSIMSCLCLVAAVIGCAWCCKTGFAKFEETNTETTVVNQNYTSFSDFSPPTMSTPSRPPGAPVPETVTIEPLPQLPGRTSNQWVNVLRVSGGAGVELNPGQTLQSIKLIDSPRFQFPRSQISYVDEMGSGWFGKVLQGEAQRMHPGLRKTRVVIKQLRDAATPEEQLLFLQEVQPYREVNHPNVLLLLGQCIDSMPLLLILEYAPFGDLKSYLRKHHDEVQEMAQQDIQLKMAADMVSGLMWLHQADFIYFDLATRNCQVSADTSVKIGDYGLALDKYPDDYYITKDNSQAIPIRWLGPEVIDLSEDGTVKTKKITKESNVWSFGIMMLELSNGAKRPYAKLTDDQVLQQVVKEQEIRVDKPNLDIHYAARWFEIMMYCWLEADIRPTMKELHDLIMYLKSNRDRVDMPDFEARWNSLKPAALQESSESSKEEEGGPPSPVQKNPPTGFQDDFVQPPTTEQPSPAKRVETSVIVPPPSKMDSPAKTFGFDSDFGTAPVSFVKSAPETPTNVPSPNRNMNAETGLPDEQPLFDDDLVLAVVQPTVESAPQPAPSDTVVDGLQSDFVMKSEVPTTQFVPLFPGLNGGLEIKDTTPEPEHDADVIPSPAATSQSSPISLQTQGSTLDKIQHSPEKVASATAHQHDIQRTSTPKVDEELYNTSANISALSPAVDDSGPNSFISTASLSFSRTPASNEVSMSFHSIASPESEDQTQFLSFDTVNTTPSTNYQTPVDDLTQTSLDNTFNTTTSQEEEPTFVILSDTAPVEMQSSNPLITPSAVDHSPTEFTSFVTADIPPSEAVVPSSDTTPLRFLMDSGVETDGSLVVEPPGDETIGQFSFLDFTDSSSTTPQHLPSNASDLAVLPSNNTLQTVDSPFTITMSTQAAGQAQDGVLSVQSETGFSSSSSSTRVMKTTRTMRQVQIVGGKEVVIVGEGGSPEDDGKVSVVPVVDGTIIRTSSGGELQMSSTSYQSSQQSSSSSMKREVSSSEQLASFNVTPGGEMTSNDGTVSIVRQSSGEMSSSTSVSRQMSSQRVSSFTSEMSSDATSMMQQMSGETSNSMMQQMSGETSNSMMQQMSGETSNSTMRQFSSSSSSSREVVTSSQNITSENTLSKQMSGELMFTLSGDDNQAKFEQVGSTSVSAVSHSSSSQSLTRSEVSSEVMPTSEHGGEAGSTVSVSRSMSASQTQQQSSSVQLVTQTSGDGQEPLNFDLSSLSLGAPSGNPLVEGEPGTTVEKTMMVSTGPGQMSVGQAMTMQGGGSAMGQMENGAQVSVQWQGSAAMKQEHSVFSTEMTSDGSASQLEGLPNQSNQRAISSTDDDDTTPDGN